MRKILEIKNEVGLEKYVTEVIQDLGIPAHIKGYHYVREAIMMAVKDSDAVFSITKVMYPKLADIFNTTSSRVERAIRHAICVSWDRARPDVLSNIFRYTVDPEKGKPTNSEFIALVSDKIRLEADAWNN